MTSRVKVVIGICATVWVSAMVVAIIYAVPILTARRKVITEIAGIKAEGKPTSTADFTSVKIPDDENGAVVYDKAFAIMSGSNWKKDDELLSSLNKRVLPDKSSAEWRRLEVTADRYHEVIPLVEVATSRRLCRFRINWNNGVMNAKMTYTAKMRQLSRLINAYAVLNARKGRMPEAMRCVALEFKESRSLQDGPMITDQIVGIAGISVASNTLRNVAHLGDIDTSSARRVYDVLSSIDLNRCCEKGLTQERAVGIQLFEDVRVNPGTLASEADAVAENASSRHRPSSGGKGQLPSSFWRYSADMNELLYLSTMSKMIEYVRPPYRLLASKGQQRDITGDALEKQFAPFAFLAAMLLPDVTRFPEKRDQGIAEINGSQIFLALLAYKDRYSAYPATLNELRRKLGWKLREDPFSGKAFVYKRQGKGFLLYSLGPNLKDDHGRGLQDLSKAERISEKTSDNYDIVWRMDR